MMSWWLISIIVVFVLLLAWGIAWAVTGNLNIFAGSDSRTVTIESSSLASSSRSMDRTTVTVDSCSVPTEAKLAECGIQSNSDISLVRMCDVTDRDVDFIESYTDEKSAPSFYKQIGHCWTDGVPGWTGFFEPRGVNDLVINLDNISGKSYNMFLSTNETDDFANGFNPGEDQPEPNFETMIGQYDTTGTLLVGVKPGIALSSTTPTFDFNVSAPVSKKMTDDIKSWTAPTAANAGFLRMSTQYIDYSFTLNSKPQVVRLYINHPTYNMATKSVRGDDGIMYFVDISDPAAPVLKELYESCVKPLTFWNQPQSDGIEQGDNPMATNFITFFKLFVIGMPIELVDRDVNFEALKTNKMSVNLVMDSTVSMRDSKIAAWSSKSWSEAEIDANKEWMAIMFEIPGLNFKGDISV